MVVAGYVKRVLLVEHDQTIAEVVAEILDESGYLADRVCDVEGALMDLQDGLLPAAVLLDSCLPGTSPIAFLRTCRLSDRLSRLPILMLVGRPLPVLEDGLRPDAVLQKPFDIDALCGAMDWVTRSYGRPSVNAACLPHRPEGIYAR